MSQKQNKEAVNYEEELEGLNRVYSKYMDAWDDLEHHLDDWLDRHPIFAKESGFVDEGPHGKPHLHNYGFDHLLTTDDPEIRSEQEFVVAWAFKEGIAQVATAIEGATDVPHEEYTTENGESD